MLEYKLGGLVILILISFNQMNSKKRKQGLTIKSVEKINKWLIIQSFMWFLLSLLYVRWFYSYERNNPNIEFTYSFIAIMYGLLGFNLFIRAFQTDTINEYGIFTSKGDFKWNEISKSEWEMEEIMKIKKGYMKYDNLVFYVRTSKIDRLITGEKYEKVIFKIARKDKEKVQKLLVHISDYVILNL